MVAALLKPKPKLSLMLPVALLAVSLIGCSPDPAPTAHPSTPTPASATMGSIVNPDARLAVTRASDNHLWLMGEDGAWLRRLTDLPGAEFSPTWSPDGTRVAFRYWLDMEGSGYGGTDVYVVNVDGSGLTNLTHSSGDSSYLSPAWSPDGTQIALSVNGEGIFVMNPDGSNLRNLSPGQTGEYPAWAPDGARIAFACFSGGNFEIFVMNADGSGPLNITRSPWYDMYPAWSPDGSKIMFSTDRSPSATPQVGSGTFKQKQIYIINPDGSGLVNLTNDPGVEDGFAAWTPAGQIAYLEMVNPDSPPQPELWMMNADGSGKRRLAADVAFVAWRP